MRQAGELFNQTSENTDRLANEFGKLRERWDNRIVLEEVSLAEKYIDGRLGLLAYGYFGCVGKTKRRRFALGIEYQTHRAADEYRFAIQRNIEVGNGRFPSRWNDEVVLVDLVQRTEPIKVALPSNVRLYFLDNSRLGTGEGLLYRGNVGVRYETFPFFVKGKLKYLLPRYISERANDLDSHVVQRGAQIMDDISDDERNWFWKKLLGNENEGECAIPPIIISAKTVRFGGDKLVHDGFEFVDVAVGPLNL